MSGHLAGFNLVSNMRLLYIFKLKISNFRLVSLAIIWRGDEKKEK